MPSPSPVRILTVCTGNICRSPVAERLLQAGLDQVQPGAFEVRSAGTRAMVGDPVQPPSAAIIETYGGTPGGFAARQLTPAILQQTDIVLTMATGHRGEVLQLDPSMLRKTFTIREFARLLGALEDRDAAGGRPRRGSDRRREPVAGTAGAARLGAAPGPGGGPEGQ